MAKLRTNHNKASKASSGNIVKVGIFGALLGGLFFVFNLFSGGDALQPLPEEGTRYYLPANGRGEVIHHRTYSLSYVEAHEQAEWVAYRLTRDEVKGPWVDRTDDFRPDDKVSTRSADPADYRGSGYDRGHLLPAADRAYSTEAMSETFLMSNISPQARHFNGGVWRELEEMTREWAQESGTLYIVTGPLLDMQPKGKIGNNEVTIPGGFYKVILDLEEPLLRGIGFVMPNTITYEPLYTFAASIDEVERMTGLDFFAGLMPEEVEAEIEANGDVDLWKFSKEKYRKRTEEWNKQ